MEADPRWGLLPGGQVIIEFIFLICSSQVAISHEFGTYEAALAGEDRDLPLGWIGNVYLARGLRFRRIVARRRRAARSLAGDSLRRQVGRLRPLARRLARRGRLGEEAPWPGRPGEDGLENRG